MHSGDALLAPELTGRLVHRFTTAPRPAPNPALDAPSDREHEVLTLISAGRSNAEIAQALFLSPGTVKTHVGRVLAKLGLRDRVHAVVFADETGLITPGAPPAAPAP